MPHSSFRLASVLSYRKSQLTEAVQEMSRIETRMQSLEHDLVRVSRERDDTLDRTVPIRATRAADLRLASQYLAVLDRRELGLQREAFQLQRDLVLARTAVKERHQAVDILNRLKGKQVAAARLDADRREQLALDEVAGLQAEIRRQQSGPRC